MIKKNVASQKIAFLMVDATDFATPETGKAITAKYSKDGAALSTCSNSVSEVTSGLYVITLAATETNADVCAYQFLNADCADQWVIVYPETITSIVSNVLSTLDDNVASELTAIKSDVTAVYSALSDAEATIVSDITAIYSALSDAEATILVGVNSILEDTASILADGDSLLVDTSYLIGYCCGGVVDSSGVTSLLGYITNSTYGLNVLETISSDILEALDSVVAGPLASILVDTKEINSQCDSILADTGTTLPASISDLLSTIDGAGIKPVTAEPSAGAPSATLPTGEKIDYLYTVFRNKIETTSGTQKVYNDAQDTVLFSCALSDDATTFTKGEHA